TGYTGRLAASRAARSASARQPVRGGRMTPYELHVGDARAILKDLPENSVHAVVTSPPYYGLRDYGVDNQIGLEATPAEYVDELVTVFREGRRVLRDDGTLWLNLGDS